MEEGCEGEEEEEEEEEDDDEGAAEKLDVAEAEEASLAMLSLAMMAAWNIPRSGSSSTIRDRWSNTFVACSYKRADLALSEADEVSDGEVDDVTGRS